MIHLLTFDVPGTPRPQGSAKWIRSKTTGKSIPAKNTNLETWRGLVSLFAHNAMLRDSPNSPGMVEVAVGLSLEFVFERPKSHFRTGKYAHELKPTAPARHNKMPDIDKLIRAVLDSLTSVIYHDDCQVDHVIATKRWGPSAGVRIVVTGMEDPDAMWEEAPEIEKETQEKRR